MAKHNPPWSEDIALQHIGDVIISRLATQGPLTVTQIAENLGYTTDTTMQFLTELEDAGEVVCEHTRQVRSRPPFCTFLRDRMKWSVKFVPARVHDRVAQLLQR